MTPLTVCIAVLLACTVASIGLTAWALGQVRVWRAYGEAWRALAERTPRTPALTRVMPQVAPWGEPSPDPRERISSRVGRE